MDVTVGGALLSSASLSQQDLGSKLVHIANILKENASQVRRVH